MTPRSEQQLQEVRDRSRERILDAALTLFAHHGFRGTSVRMIAEAAKVSQGLLYNYFDGKLGLLRAIFDRGAEEVDATLVTAAEAADPAEAPARLVRAAFDAVRADIDFWRLAYQIRMQPEVVAEVGVEMAARRERIRGRLEELLGRAGSPRPAVRARALFAAVDGAAQHFVLDPEGYPLNDVAAEIVLLLRAHEP